ncbi:MAG TPA: alpha/beta fold hydrolase [Nitrospiria bacterium]
MLSGFFAIFLFLILFSLFGLLVSIRPPRIHSHVHPAQYVSSFEDITLKTSDGLALKGWFIPQPKSDKVIVALHGYPADKGDILPGLFFLNKDFNLLFFDFRYFGESEGFITTVGAREVRDLLASLEFLKTRGFHKIGVWGFSLGGAVALMRADHSSDIKAIVSESAYAELSLMARETYRHLLILKYPLGLLTGIWAKLLLGVNIYDVSPVKKIKNSQNPILIIHSTTDQVIPFSHALLLKEALGNNPKAEFWFREGLSHGQLGTEYENRIRGFFQKYL